jgi:hypothetical protein
MTTPLNKMVIRKFDPLYTGGVRGVKLVDIFVGGW